MKKIFAIALALVMVLSMASAFAFCDVIDWSTSTNCGTGSVEVVPYAIGNKVGGNTYTATDCAAAVNNQPVFFAVKVTVDANPNADWWTKARLTVSQSGLGTAAGAATTYVDFKNQGLNFGQAYPLFTSAANVAAGTYYLTYNGPVDSFDPATCLFSAAVADAATAKVCAELKFDGKASAANGVDINGYTVKVVENTDKTWDLFVGDVVFGYNKLGYISKAVVGSNIYTKYVEAADTFQGVANNAIFEAKNDVCKNIDDYKAIKDAMAAVNITWGQKISYATAAAKLAKLDKVSDCATWNSEALAIVNAECAVLSIPKTGDASVLAWLF